MNSKGSFGKDDAFKEYAEFEARLAKIRTLDIGEKEQEELIKLEYNLLKEAKIQDKKKYECRNDVTMTLFAKYNKVTKMDLNKIDSISNLKEVYAFTEDLMNTVKTLAAVEKNIKIIHFVETTDLIEKYDENILEYYESLMVSLELESDEEDRASSQTLFYSCVSAAVSMFQQIIIDEQMFYEAFGFPNFEELEKHTLEMFTEDEIGV
jgi:hypothetical protein